MMLVTAIIFLLIAVAVLVLSRPLPAWPLVIYCVVISVSSFLLYLAQPMETYRIVLSLICWLAMLVVLLFADPYALKLSTKILMIIVLLFTVANAILTTLPQKEIKTETAQPTVTVSTTAKEQALAQAKQVLEDAGWKDSDYTLEVVDPSIDGSITGQGAFYLDGIHNAAEMVAFLKSGTESANAAIESIIKDTGATKEEILDTNNWIAVQPNVAFNYPGNTGFINGQSTFLGNRPGASGDIFMIFVAPTTDKATAVRGACSNPQTKIPTPTPKSSNPADYKQPGDGTERDSGTGTKPKAIVTTPPEVSPPPVVETTQSPTGVTDSSVAKPGTETGVSAPGTMPGSTTNEPAPETNVNPPVGDTNTINIGNPFQ